MGARRGAAAALLLALSAGCAAPGDEAATPSPPTSPPTSSSPSSGATPDAPPSAPAVPAEDPPPCADVRAGIDAFNLGDPGQTVARFARALPLAEQYVRDEPGRTADLLLEAVTYYADLAPEDYQEAFASSPEFRRHQVVTLAVCRYEAPPAAEEDDAVPA